MLFYDLLKDPFPCKLKRCNCGRLDLVTTVASNNNNNLISTRPPQKWLPLYFVLPQLLPDMEFETETRV
jgi:hypothetical protein